MNNNLAKQISHINGQITTINNEIALIDSSVIGHTGLNSLVHTRKTQLTRRLDALRTLRSQLNSSQTNNTIGFNSSQQAIVTDINNRFHNKYETHMEKLRTLQASKKNEFFSLYNAADTDFVKETLIKTFF